MYQHSVSAIIRKKEHNHIYIIGQIFRSISIYGSLYISTHTYVHICIVLPGRTPCSGNRRVVGQTVLSTLTPCTGAQAKKTPLRTPHWKLRSSCLAEKSGASRVYCNFRRYQVVNYSVKHHNSLVLYMGLRYRNSPNAQTDRALQLCATLLITGVWNSKLLHSCWHR